MGGASGGVLQYETYKRERYTGGRREWARPVPEIAIEASDPEIGPAGWKLALISFLFWGWMEIGSTIFLCEGFPEKWLIKVIRNVFNLVLCRFKCKFKNN